MPSIIKTSIVTIGDEILLGQVTDTNSEYLAKTLTQMGVTVVHKMTIPDNHQDLISCLDFISQNSDVVLVTGGLGPTKDDGTKQTVATYFNDSLILDILTEEKNKQLLASRGVSYNSLNSQQALRPSKAKSWINALGTADALYIFDKKTHFIFFPGVPFELKHLVNSHLKSWLKDTFSIPVWCHKTILVKGYPESELALKIADWENGLPSHFKLAYLPSGKRVRLRISAYALSEATDLELSVVSCFAHLKPLLGDAIDLDYTDELEQRVKHLMIERGYTLSVAESCTGGYVASKITAVTGASDFFMGGITAYHPSIKQKYLEITPEACDQGLVRPQIASAMAKQIQNKFNTHIGVGITGSAGPDLSPIDLSPVGTVYVAVALPDGAIQEHQLFFPHLTRTEIIHKTHQWLMDFLIKTISSN